ncbi:hypothetical protein F5887DRAFT_968193 [Amanita rubescens]|nr:hypothetical protein F5887DRAFT_1012540 [Amanita rubescens]KAF8345131.1 hypothetical protein F5887DRAFT_968193 [Amanita rubescens]
MPSMEQVSSTDTGVVSPRAEVRRIPRINNAEALGKGIVATNKNKTKEYTILLVGETGTGKTTLLSLFANVLAGRSPSEFKPGHIQGNEAGGEENQSQTESAKIYELESQNGIKVRILDTPGLVDTRGIAQDELHKADIAKVIQESVTSVNAVIILTNGTVKRLTVTTDYALSTLSSMFPRTLAYNIGIMFTCAVGRLRCHFRSQSLPEALRGIKGNQFILDNPVAMWQRLNEISEDGDVEGEDGGVGNDLEEFESEIEECHKKALKELGLFFDWLDTLTPQPTKDILTVYERYLDIDRDIDNVLSHASQIMEQKAELTRLEESAKSHELNMEQYRKIKNIPIWEQIDRARYNTICRHPGCHANCHVGCTLPFSLNPENIKTCRAITRAESECRMCRHPVTEHYHSHSLWLKRNQAQEVIKKGSEEEYHDAKQQNDENEKRILHLRGKITQLDKAMEEKLIILGRLTAAYASLCLNGNFIGHVQKSIKILELNLEAIRQKGNAADPRVLQLVEKTLSDMNKRLKILQRVDKVDPANGGRADRGTSEGTIARLKGTVKSGMQAISTAFRPGRTPKRQGARSSMR